MEMTSVLSAFVFDGEGSLKDRLITALIILICVFLISLAAVYLPMGRLLAVAWGFAIVGMCSLEVARLLARDFTTHRYLPVKGVVLFLQLIAPALGVTIASIDWVIHHRLDLTFPYACIVAASVSVVISHVSFGRRDLDVAAREAERFAPAFILVSLCGTQLIPVAAHHRGIQMLWWVVGSVAINDAAAYFVGRSLGRHKMAPALSPNKSVEGSVAGVFFGSVFGFFLWDVLVGISLPSWMLLVMTVLAIAAAQAADLSKSYVKRLCGVKDTGAFFPGHGGVLDRFDGAIGAAPVLLIFVVLIGL